MNTNKTQAEQLPQDAVMQSVFKENDLRIGNFIKVISSTRKFDSYITQVKGYDIVRIEEKSFKYWNYEPIPLTEEWHNKFGVYKNGFNSFEYVLPEKNNLKIILVFSGDYCFMKQGRKDIISIWNKDLTKREMYVHELQNLYFALTQRELTVA